MDLQPDPLEQTQPAQRPQRVPPDVTQPARPVPPDATQPARPVPPDVTQPARRIPPDATQPARPVQPDTTQPVRPLSPDVTQPARPGPPGGAPRYQPPPAAPLPREPVWPAHPPVPATRARHLPHRRRWRGPLLALLALAAVVCLAGGLLYGLLLAPAPTNVLILGVDRRPGEGDATRADTILLLRVAPRQRHLAMLSIPRDLWVTIPGRGEARINTAHVYGELEAPGSGPARVAETVTHNFGLPVHHTLRLDFDAFRAVIDAAGGIEIDVPAPIVDEAYPTDDYGTTRIEIPAGRQHMDGETALRYARSRHGSSDFDRAARQQQILVALVKKLTSPGGWLRAPRVYRAWQDAVETDMSLRDLARLALAWQRAGESGLERIVIDRTMTTAFQTAEGAAVLLPRWELIQPLVQAQFNP